MRRANHTVQRPVQPILKIGFATDLHYADADTSGTRYFRDAIPKLQDAVAAWNAQECDFVMINGDFIDHSGTVNSTNKAKAETDLTTLKAVLDVFNGPVHFAIGNHCIDQLTKAEYQTAVGMPNGYYSFDDNGVHIIVLDGNFSSADDGDAYGPGEWDGYNCYVNNAQLTWLEGDLAATSLPVLVFSHYRVSGAGEVTYKLWNAAAVRSILEAGGEVKAVFCGHRHTNDFNVVNGIPYIEMMALTEGAYPANAYSTILVWPDFSITVDGVGGQRHYGI